MIRNNISVLKSSFMLSIENISQAPSVLYTEIAILGRSNVGKSSLINALLNNKNLAKSSSTPGKTRLINFFLSTWRLKRELDSNNIESNKVESKEVLDSKDSRQNALESSPLVESKMQDSKNILDFAPLADSKVSKSAKSSLESSDYDLRFIDFPGFGYAKVSKEQKKAWDKNLSIFLKKRDSIKLYIHLRDSRHQNLAIDNEISSFLGSFARGDSTILEVFTKSDKLSKSELLALKRSGKLAVSNTSKDSIAALRSKILNILYKV